MSLEMKPIENLLNEIPAQVLERTVDDVLIEYSICSIKDEQAQTRDEAVDNVRNLQRIKRALQGLV